MGTKWKDRNVSEINKQIGPLDYTSYLRHSKRLRSVQCTYTQCKKCLGYTSVQNRLYLSLKTRDSLFPTDIFQPRVEEKQNYPPIPHTFRLLNYERFIKHKTIFLCFRSTEIWIPNTWNRSIPFSGFFCWNNIQLLLVCLTTVGSRWKDWNVSEIN